MDTRPAFYEKQRFTQWWLWLIVIAACAPVIIILFTQVITGEPVGDKPATTGMLAAMSLPLIGLIWLFAKSALHTKVDAAGIHVRFAPFHRKWRFYPWERVTRCEVKKFSPMMDYGGWGIKGNSYTVRGNMGVLVSFTDRYSQMIGTQQPEAFRKALELYGK